MSFGRVLILQLVILGVVLESDLGRKKIGGFRVARPLVAAILIVPFFITGFPTSDHNLLLQGLGALAGIVLGLIAVSPALVAVDFDPYFQGRLARLRKKPGKPSAISVAGAGYAGLWILVSVARIIFSYTSQHEFPDALQRFLVQHQLAADGLTNALMFLAVGMDTFRSIGLIVRARRALQEGRQVTQPGDEGLTSGAGTAQTGR